MLPEVAQSASRLMEALEKLSEWAGSGPGGNGPSGPPSDDVVRAFEEAMAGAPEEAAGAAGEFSVQAAAEAPGPAASVPPLDGGNVQEMGTEKIAPATSGDIPPSPGLDGAEPRADAVNASEVVDTGSRTEIPDESVFFFFSPREENPARELGRLLEEFSSPGAIIGPDALFRAQYLVGMLKVQAQAGLKTSQSASQGMENILRQQG